MKWLPDVNLLIALVTNTHLHHAAAQSWFAAHSRRGWCTVPLTELGVLRILCHPTATGDPFDLAGALDVLRQMKAHSHWQFVETAAPCERVLGGMQIQGHNQINDAYLLGFAAGHQLVVATFDKGFSSLLKRADKRRAHVQIVPFAAPH